MPKFVYTRSPRLSLSQSVGLLRFKGTHIRLSVQQNSSSLSPSSRLHYTCSGTKKKNEYTGDCLLIETVWQKHLLHCCTSLSAWRTAAVIHEVGTDEGLPWRTATSSSPGGLEAVVQANIVESSKMAHSVKEMIKRGTMRNCTLKTGWEGELSCALRNIGL
jgi:hypothetical protein